MPHDFVKINKFFPDTFIAFVLFTNSFLEALWRFKRTQNVFSVRFTYFFCPLVFSLNSSIMQRGLVFRASHGPQFTFSKIDGVISFAHIFPALNWSVLSVQMWPLALNKGLQNRLAEQKIYKLCLIKYKAKENLLKSFFL